MARPASDDVLNNQESVTVAEEKRDGETESAAPPLKKPRFDEDVNKVAEIMQVLSALRKIRGGKSPTELELELIMEARSKLTEMCEEFTPKDIICRDDEIEDVGLNNKMEEESKKHPIVSTSCKSPANNVSKAHQESKVSTSSVNATGSHFIKNASEKTQSRMERPQLKSDMHTGASQRPEAVTDPSFRTFMSQSPRGIKGVNFGAEITEIIQKHMQPPANQNNLLRNLPSREYISKAMTCETCRESINEVETVIICDACEKGYHLKCLQGNNMKRVPKSWHCSRCVELYNGKSFPRKYGCVMRSATTTAKNVV